MTYPAFRPDRTQRRPSLRLLVLASTTVLLAGLLAPPPVNAKAPVAAVPQAATASSLKLFPDSHLVVRDRISVEVTGSGPDIVMIPGLASSRETWRHEAERLRGHYRVHLVQVAGFAGEPARANATGPFFDPVLAEIDAYLVSLPKPSIVMGHSLGGTLGLAEAERHPDHLSKLLIVDALPFYGVLMGGPTATVDSVRPIAEGMRANMKGALPPEQARAMASQMVTAPGDVSRVVEWMSTSATPVVAMAMTDDMLADLRPDLAKVKVPTTILYETALEPMMQSGYATLGSKTLVAIPDAKHFIMLDQPTRFDAEVDAFLKR